LKVVAMVMVMAIVIGQIVWHAGKRAGLVAAAKVRAKIEAQAVSAWMPAATQCGDRHVSLRMVIGAIIPWTIT
jgi:hypothetical protein